MNTITHLKKDAIETGSIYENSCGTYLLGEFNEKFFLVNLETGATWNGFQSRIEDLFSKSDFRLVNYPVKLTPDLD